MVKVSALVPPRRQFCIGALGAKKWPELDLKSNRFNVPVVKFHNLLKAFLPNCVQGKRKVLKLLFDHRSSDRTLAHFIPGCAGFKRHVKNDHRRRNLIALRQREQIPASLSGQRGGIDDAQPIQNKPLMDDEMNEIERLRVESLVALVVAYNRSSPVRGNNLRGAKMLLGKS